jgi:hypothetical protein
MRKLDLILGLIAAGGVLGTLLTWQNLSAERERSANLQRQITALNALAAQPAAPQPERPLVTGTPIPAAQPQKTAPAGTTIAYLTKEEAKELANRREIAAVMRKNAERERVMLRDPAYRQNQREEMRQRYAPMRADAIRVGMTPQQADRIVDLELDRIAHYNEMAGTAGETPTAAVQAEMKREGEAAEAEAREMLGEDLYAKWNQFRASVQERGEVSQWRAQLSEPLTDQQADAVAQSLYVERQRRSSEYEDYVKSAGITDRYVVAPEDRQHWLDLEKEANQRTHDAMAGSLSAAQLTSLDAMLAARLVPIETALKMQLEGKLAKQD